jgi:hypothetical protein
VSFSVGSFLLGLFLGGFLSAIGADAWVFLKSKIWPGPVAARQVARDFEPEGLSQGSYSWAGKEKQLKLQNQGHTYYTDENGARCFREYSMAGGQTGTDFLMVSPVAAEPE